MEESRIDPNWEYYEEDPEILEAVYGGRHIDDRGLQANLFSRLPFRDSTAAERGGLYGYYLTKDPRGSRTKAGYKHSYTGQITDREHKRRDRVVYRYCLWCEKLFITDQQALSDYCSPKCNREAYCLQPPTSGYRAPCIQCGKVFVPSKKRKFVCDFRCESYLSCHSIRRRVALRSRVTGLPFDSKIEQRFRTLWAQGVPLKEIGERLSMQISTVSRWRVVLNLPTRAKQPRKNPRICPTCGQHYRARANIRFCSRTCRDKSLLRQVEVVCTCGKKLTAKLSRKQKYCSRKCAAKQGAAKPPAHEVLERFRVQYQAGELVKDLMAQFKVTKETISRWRKLLKLPKRYKTKQW